MSATKVRCCFSRSTASRAKDAGRTRSRHFRRWRQRIGTHATALECRDEPSRTPPLWRSRRFRRPPTGVLGHPADRLIDRAPAMRLHGLADLGVSGPPIGRVFGSLVGPRPVGGKNILRKCNGQLGLPAFGLFLRHGTKWYSVVRNSKNSRLSHSRLRASAPRPGKAKRRRSRTPSRGCPSARRDRVFSNRSCVEKSSQLARSQKTTDRAA